MAQRPTGDWDIDPNTTSGTDLANILNRFQDAIDSGNSGSSRPPYLAAGGLWVQEGNPMKLMFWTGSEDIEVFNTDDGSGIGAGMVISATEPEKPKEGMQWLNSVTAEVFIYDGAVWLEFPGGKDGAPGADGADGKQIWSEVTPDGDIYYDKGNVGIGTDTPPQKLSVGSGYIDLDDGYGFRWGGGTTTSIYGNQSTNTLYLQTSGGPKLTIDATGNATFSGTARFQTLSNPLMLRTGDDYYSIGVSASGNTEYKTWNTHVFESGSSNPLTMDVTGDATFSGTVTVNGNRPVSTTFDLIKTLTTLRNATKDETTLEGLRDAIGNAIGGLIEEFENQIATMPAEEQASTQEIEQ